MDRCLVLADDTASREHAYTALSRGRHGNDLYVATDDQRSEERHAQELHPGPLDGLRAAIRRSASTRLALDDLDVPQMPTLDRLDLLDRQIDMMQRLDHAVSRSIDRGLERSQRIELGG